MWRMNEPQFDLDVVLSLFDGISCGQMALKRAGLTPRVYYASEVEKSPMHITKKNFPSTIMLGDVRNVVADDLPHVNLLMGGSPCTGFSFAGKGLAFDDPRSALFFEFVRLLKECSPDYFLLENVMMKKEFKDIITEHLGVEPVMINSSLVSAQNRKRLYWTNIPGVGQPDDLQINLIDVIENGYVEEEKSATIKNQYYKSSKANFERSGTFHATGVITNRPITQPKDKGILLKDVLETNADNKYNLSESKVDRVLNSERGKGYFYDEDSEKIGTVIAGYHKLPTDGSYVKRPTKPKVLIKEEWNPKQTKNYVQWDIHGKGHKSQDQRAYYEDGKHGALPAAGGQSKVKVMCEDSVVELNENQKRKIDKINTTTDKSNCITTAIGRGGSSTEYLTSVKKKTLALDEKVLCHSLKEVRTEEAKQLRKEHREKTGKDHTPFRAKKLVPREDGKVGTLTPSLNKTHKVLIVSEATKKGYTEIEDGDCFDATFMSSKTRRGRNMKDKSNCLTAANYDYMRYEHPTYRKLTVLECSRLQTLPDSYLQDCYDEKGKEISNTQKYKALGNGWTVDVIVHILQGLKWQS